MCNLLNKIVQFLFGALSFLSRIDFAPSYNDNWNYAYSPDSALSEREKTNRKIGPSLFTYRIYLSKNLASLKGAWIPSQAQELPWGKSGSWSHSNILKLRICKKCNSVWASLVAQTINNLPSMEDTLVWSLGWEDPLGKEMATHSSSLAWKIPRTEEPGGPQSWGC